MVCVEDALDGLGWAEGLGGGSALIARSAANLAAISNWVDRTDWAGFLAAEPDQRSSTSVCLKIVDPWFQGLDDETQSAVPKKMDRLLAEAGAAFDINGYRDAPPGLRVWAGSTVETSDLEALMPWIDWAYATVKVEISEFQLPDHSNAQSTYLRQPERTRRRNLQGTRRGNRRNHRHEARGVDRLYREYDGLAVRSATKVTADVLEAAENLKVIGRAGIGVDNIDVDGASGRGIVVMNAPFGNSITTAEHAIAMMFALARQIPLANQSTQSGQWEKSRFMGVELTGKTLGIVGCGNIGSIVAERTLGLKMKVIASDPYLTPEHAAEIGVEKVELDELFSRAEIITLHTPSTDLTRGMLNAENFAKMRDGVMVVNCARGELVVEADMKTAIESESRRFCGRRVSA